MKNVAATSGQSVSFAFLFVEVTARAGNWAGRDKVLNFLSRPPSATLALSQPRAWSEFASCRIRIFTFDARKMCKEPNNFSPRSSAKVRYGARRFLPARNADSLAEESSSVS
jgi:hypothetical protein